MKNPRFLLWIIILLTVISVFVNLPSSFNLSIKPFKPVSFDKAAILSKIKITKKLDFRKGLDLEGGTSITLKAEMKNIPSTQRKDALESAKSIIERRVNLFGVAESIVQTSTVNGEYRIIVELPGVTDLNEVRKLIGTTAELTFWEEVGTQSGKFKENQPNYPLNLPSGYNRTNLTGNDLKQSAVGFNQNTGNPQVLLTFTSDGSQKFGEITKRVVGKRLAIVLDNMVIEAPSVNEPILGGNAEISGGFTVETAKALATELNAGALPVPLTTLQSHVIGPTLGLSSLQKSLFAGALGFVVIVIFMIILYGSLGVIASVALALYTLFVLAIFKLSSLTPYSITLTLSGIAGFILSIGMAVDANILIFERIKEELRAGKNKRVALEMGFSRAWTSIRDSNISTLITSAVLYKFGIGTVKGFALVLAIGVLVSMFSAIVVTRTFLKLVYK
ncbi:MAG: protein translocase subunit SecD [Candidatus Levybacteria bacterium CG_4_9_14_3_um_filter_35_16]|nr:MAG: protein translocase subunit SecD [Candidatus Levybacteria bacterium CG22_combo_CG10-13_8_21_14_all_35_11]PJA91402.1 MAG: protein translocase subunit SecD [Candidatus Levybacteria bacterium CG_4_9_14_3_um_filter_35_16]PJC54193.1 MAG: protein translocase subunit SecD [Candidatus Levybacteria bacterium CG_4_9_14_0_2_um_filter_35_21]